MDQSEIDQHAGETIRRLRAEKDMTQADLAEAVTAEGVQMHPLTVLKIEKGTRPLRLAEIMAMLKVLDGNWDELDPPTPLEDVLYDIYERYQDAGQDLRRQIADYMHTWAHTRSTFAAFAEARTDLPSHVPTGEDIPDDVFEEIAKWAALAEDDFKKKRPESAQVARDWMAELERREAALQSRLKAARGEPADEVIEGFGAYGEEGEEVEIIPMSELDPETAPAKEADRGKHQEEAQGRR